VTNPFGFPLEWIDLNAKKICPPQHHPIACLPVMSNNPIEPHLVFGGRCEEALEFYRTMLGAQIDMVLRFKESPQPMPPGSLPAGFENKVMHASFRINGSRLMASDGNEAGTKFSGFSLSLTAPTEAEVDRVFAALTQGGKVSMPLTKTFWSPKFGMVTDRFGISWMVSLAAPDA
jgi:PhnB protein